MGEGSGKQVAIALKTPSYIGKGRLTRQKCFTTDLYLPLMNKTDLVSWSSLAIRKKDRLSASEHGSAVT